MQGVHDRLAGQAQAIRLWPELVHLVGIPTMLGAQSRRVWRSSDLEVSWQPPAPGAVRAGGIAQYELQLDGAAVHAGSASRCTITGVAPGSTVALTVRAQTESGAWGHAAGPAQYTMPTREEEEEATKLHQR